MKNYPNGCGYGCLFCAPSEKEKATTKYQRKNSAGLAILWTTVSEELQGILLENDKLFLTAWNALGDACGKNSTVTICQALTQLTSLMYEPGSSLDSHIDLFLKLYASYKSLVGSSCTKIELSKEMAAAFFLQSLDQDQDLSSLVQNLYDVQPFDITTITKRVALEQSRRDNVATEGLFTNNRTQSNKGSSKNPSSNNTLNPPPTQGKGDNKKRQHHKKKRRERTRNYTESVSKKLEKLKKLFLNNSLTTSANSVTTKPSLDQSPEKEHCSSDSDAYYLPPENIFATDYQDRQTLYLDMGCGRSVVNNLALLSNVISVNKNIRTFGSPFKITHHGTMNLFGYHIAPVSFAPKGPVSLISVLQLVDHGIRPHYKNNNFLIKQGNSIVAAFTRDAEKTTLCALTHEQYSDAMRFLDIESGKIIISHNFIVPSTVGSSKAHKQTETLPNELKEQQYGSMKLPVPKLTNPIDKSLDNTAVIPGEADPGPVTRTQRLQVKRWDYVPHYDTAPQNISSKVDEQKILKDSRWPTRRRNQALLTDVVPYSKAVQDTQEKEKWHNAMNAEFSSLMQHNTGHLVLYPRDGSTVIRGMWCLAKKRNEFGELYRYKARWVVLGNHQVHMLHYFDT
ncbi:hypothetical protein O181_097175 [Austropuccinia psidii MF-1]|uniref:Uncharacterized protein n=1 Tax=Austropuccinia psidii MF-1 TaxID=1389203 RepID=A0A9Q3J702_9BASI|nr:hypothetical protein [Austropuccinia psidii MF-1]